MKTPETINQMIDYVSGVKSVIKQKDLKKKLFKIESQLRNMKSSPELHNSCSLDFKIDNPGYFLNKIENIIAEDDKKL